MSQKSSQNLGNVHCTLHPTFMKSSPDCTTPINGRIQWSDLSETMTKQYLKPVLFIYLFRARFAAEFFGHFMQVILVVGRIDRIFVGLIFVGLFVGVRVSNVTLQVGKTCVSFTASCKQKIYTVGIQNTTIWKPDVFEIRFLNGRPLKNRTKRPVFEWLMVNGPFFIEHDQIYIVLTHITNL